MSNTWTLDQVERTQFQMPWISISISQFSQSNIFLFPLSHNWRELFLTVNIFSVPLRVITRSQSWRLKELPEPTIVRPPLSSLKCWWVPFAVISITNPIIRIINWQIFKTWEKQYQSSQQNLSNQTSDSIFENQQNCSESSMVMLILIRSRYSVFLIDQYCGVIFDIIMKRLCGILKDVENQPSQVSLSYNGITHYKSRTGGFVTMAAYIVIIVVFVYKLLDVISKNHIYVAQNMSMQHYNSSIDLSDLLFELELKIYKDSQFVFITSQNQFEYGVNVTISEQVYTVIDNFPIPSIKEESIGFYKQIYVANRTKNMNFNVSGARDISLQPETTPDGQFYRGLLIKVKLCDRQISGCKPFTDYPMYLAPFYLNRAINTSALDEEEIFSFEQRMHLKVYPQYLQQNTTMAYFYRFKGINVQIDESVLPDLFHLSHTQKTKSTWLFDNEFEYEKRLSRDSTLAQITLARSLYNFDYSRSYKKLDSFLAQLFGLVGLILGIKYAIIGGYNSWKFYRFRQSLNQQSGTQSDNIFKYYCDEFRSYCGLCQHNRYQRNLDYYQMLQRMERLERKCIRDQPFEGQYGSDLIEDHRRSYKSQKIISIREEQQIHKQPIKQEESILEEVQAPLIQQLLDSNKQIN